MSATSERSCPNRFRGTVSRSPPRSHCHPWRRSGQCSIEPDLCVASAQEDAGASPLHKPCRRPGVTVIRRRGQRRAAPASEAKRRGFSSSASRGRPVRADRRGGRLSPGRCPAARPPARLARASRRRWRARRVRRRGRGSCARRFPERAASGLASKPTSRARAAPCSAVARAVVRSSSSISPKMGA